MKSNKTLHEVCDAFGVTRRAVQGYEKAGLVHATGKNKYGYLLYDEEAQQRIARIKISFKFSQKDDMYNEGGIKIISKGAVKDAYESSDDVHLVFLVENGTSTDIDISDSWDSLSVNGYMIDYSASSTCAYAGKSAVIDVQIWGSKLEENNISGVDDITSAEITFELEDADGNDIAEPKVSVNY